MRVFMTLSFSSLLSRVAVAFAVVVTVPLSLTPKAGAATKSTCNKHAESRDHPQSSEGLAWEETGELSPSSQGAAGFSGPTIGKNGFLEAKGGTGDRYAS